MKQRDILSWLTGCPASDLNFKNALAEANRETCEAALKHVTAKGAITAIERRLRKLPAPAAPPAAPESPTPKGRVLTLGDLDVLPPVRRVTKAAPVSLDVLETQIRDLLHSDISREQEWQRTAIYDRVAIGLCLLKGRELHLQKAGRPKNGGNGSTISKAEQKAETGFLDWIEVQFPGFSTRTARNYMNGARNCGLTSDHGLEDVEALRTAQALHDKTAKELYQIKDAVKPTTTDAPAPAPNLVADLTRDLFGYLDDALTLRDQMEPEAFEAVHTRLHATLEKLTGAKWIMADDAAALDGAQHGELHTPKANTKAGKAAKKKGAKGK